MCCGNTNNTGCNGGCNDRCNDPCNKCQPSRCECLVRYSGPDIDCLGVETDDSFETVITKVAGFVCDLTFEDGTDGTNGTDGTDGTNGENGLDANSNYGNTLFVDQIYGDDGTALRERFDLPYRNIQTAINAAQPGDTVWTRTGTYTESLILENLVNLHFEKVTVNGQIKDNGVQVKSTISGRLTLKYTGNNTLEITGPGTDLIIDMEEINSTRTAIYMNPIGERGTTNTMTLTLDRITGLEINYVVNLVGVSNLRIDVRKYIRTKEYTINTSNVVIIRINTSFSGRMYMDCPEVHVGGSNEQGVGLFYSEEPSEAGAGGEIMIRVKRIEAIFSVVGGMKSPTDFGFVNRVGRSNLSLEVGKVGEVQKDFMHVKGEGVGSTFFRGQVETTVCAFRYASTAPLVLKDTRIYSRESLMSAIIIGNPVGEGVMTEGIEGNYDLSIEDSTITRVTNRPTPDPTDTIILKSGVAPVYIKNTEIYGTGTFNGTSIRTDGGTEKDMYLKNVVSNFNVDATTVTNTATGTFDFDPALKATVVRIA